jgi:hypothetical protein
MKKLLPHAFNVADCERELSDFKALLSRNPKLSESKDILPFFKKNKHLSAFIASAFPKMHQYDLIAHEFDIFGDFAADLVIGDSRSKAFAFVEFEDGTDDSVFISKRRSTPDWAYRVEHGVSQVMDWYWKLGKMAESVDFETRFGSRSITMFGLVIAGRRTNLSARERDRLKWREESVICASKYIYITTFDDLADDLEFRLKYRK